MSGSAPWPPPLFSLRASPLRSTTTTRERSGFFRSTSCRGSFPREEWDLIERGLIQRITALNLFLHDIYHGQNILRDGVIPKQIVWEAAHFRPEFMHFDVPRNIYIHICGTDLIRDRDGNYLVLEDNARCPSGRLLRARKSPDDEARFSRACSAEYRVRPVEDYSQELLNVLRYIAPPAARANRRSFCSRRAIYNSAYSSTRSSPARWVSRSWKGGIWSRGMASVFMRTTKGLKPVDVIYRRINDDFLDPRVFRKDSGLGVPGLVDAYRRGNCQSGEFDRHRHGGRQGGLPFRARR